MAGTLAERTRHRSLMAWLSARAGESLGFCKGRRGGPDREARAVCRACGAPGGVAGSRRADANRRARPGHRSSAAASSASRVAAAAARAAGGALSAAGAVGAVFCAVYRVACRGACVASIPVAMLSPCLRLKNRRLGRLRWSCLRLSRRSGLRRLLSSGGRLSRSEWCRPRLSDRRGLRRLRLRG